MCLKIFPLTLLLLLNIPATSLASPPQPTAFSVGGFEFQRPEGFQWIATTSSLRKAELRVHKQDWPEPVQVLFFHFGPDQGGTIEANISRWLSQFQEPVEKLNAQRADQTVGKTKITMLRAKGTFLSGMPGQQPTPKPNYGLLAAILSGNEGDVYVKMTGPAPAVESLFTDFERMILQAAK